MVIYGHGVKEDKELMVKVRRAWLGEYVAVS